MGFVLPTSDTGCFNCHCYVVDSFEIVKQFGECPKANYAYVYVVQPLKINVPSFCLGCVGNDNKFSFDKILWQWKYICSELVARGIRVISLALDSDTRLLMACLLWAAYYLGFFGFLRAGEFTVSNASSTPTIQASDMAVNNH